MVSALDLLIKKISVYWVKFDGQKSVIKNLQEKRKPKKTCSPEKLDFLFLLTTKRKPVESYSFITLDPSWITL